MTALFGRSINASANLDTALKFEQGPIRPPAEARSLLLRFTRNCPWARCKFCPVYHGEKFSRRSLAEIKTDIDTAALMIAQLEELSHGMGRGGRIDETVINRVFSTPGLSNSYRSVAAWLHFGTGGVFLQDANNMILRPETMHEALEYLQAKIKGIKYISTYGRSSTVSRIPQAELDKLRAAGLSCMHMGFESGSDKVLKLIQKGTTAAKHVEAGQKVKAAGITLNAFYMPGLGGVELSLENAMKTAQVMNAVDPDFIRIRTLRLVHGFQLYEDYQAGRFQRLDEDQAVKEIRLFIENLKDITSRVESDHIINLLDGVKGDMPQDKPAMLKAIDDYFALGKEDRQLFRLGRRMCKLDRPEELDMPGVRGQLKTVADRFPDGASLEDKLTEMADTYI